MKESGTRLRGHMAPPAPAGTRLAQLARTASRPPEPQAPVQEVCDLCSAPVPPEHRHLVDLHSRQMMCACRACKILFDRKEAGEGHYRLIPERRELLEGFVLADEQWAALQIPVDMAFFFHNTSTGRVMAFYPGPMGPTESLLELSTWDELVAANPVLAELEPDVEALLVNRARGAREHYLVGVDECYALVGLIRTSWKGLSGGDEVWQEIDGFFDRLARRAEEAR
ncbi:MAG TPA: DUF5947 family protein [Solirubrobacteraceae bacterium]|nr:DUF5947 family protein [Solirubrobacteraceae bacterium]